MAQWNMCCRKQLFAVGLTALLASPLSVQAALPGDTNASGSVSIAEVQKVINAFLGIVPDIVPVKVMYGSTSSFRVSADNLGGTVVTSTGACTTLTEQPGGTTTLRTFTCIPDAVGTVDIAVKAASNGAILAQAQFNVPSPQVTMETSKGTIVVELNPVKAPKTVNNFLRYVQEGFYKDTIFHRVVKGFVIQGGGYDTTYAKKANHDPIELEPPSATGLTNVIGTIAMARVTYDSSNPLEARSLNSATSQFFFNAVNNTFLDTNNGGYAVFGSVIQGLDVVKVIEAVPVNNTTENVPVTMVTVTAATQTR